MFKKSFLTNTPKAILQHGLELADIIDNSGEMLDYGFNRFTPQEGSEKSKILVNLIAKYVSIYDEKFDQIAAKHNMTDQDLGAFLWYLNGEADLTIDWFNNIKKQVSTL